MYRQNSISINSPTSKKIRKNRCNDSSNRIVNMIHLASKSTPVRPYHFHSIWWVGQIFYLNWPFVSHRKSTGNWPHLRCNFYQSPKNKHNNKIIWKCLDCETHDCDQCYWHHCKFSSKIFRHGTTNKSTNSQTNITNTKNWISYPCFVTNQIVFRYHCVIQNRWRIWPLVTCRPCVNVTIAFITFSVSKLNVT